MKKAALLVFAALLVVMFSVPALAMEHQFGGYWRTRFYTYQNFDGNEMNDNMEGLLSPVPDETVVDTRTRLYYTVVFHENLKFRNEFEFDGTWGSGRGSRLGGLSQWTDLGADGANLEIKKSYVDFNLGPLNAQIGVQGACIARGFLFCAPDFPGMTLSYMGDNMVVPFIWMKAYEGGGANNALDVDYFGLNPQFTMDNITINPYVFYGYSENARNYNNINRWMDFGAGPGFQYDEYNIYWAGIDVDMNFGPASLWFTGIYNGGEADFVSTVNIGGNATNSEDFSAWLGAIGGSVGFGTGNIHGEVFYATGDDDLDDEFEGFQGIGEDGNGQNFNQSYYWSEIMGMGIFDWVGSNNSPGDAITNILAANLGATVKPMDKMSVSLDAWYAQLAEDIILPDGSKEDELGIEVDLKITYELVEGLKLDVVGAYLFAGDATTMDHPDDADPYEIGSRLSLSF